MISHHLLADLATARRNDLIAEATAARLTRQVGRNRHHWVELWTLRHPTLSRFGRAAGRERSTARTVSCGPQATS